jgi:hypothetical protein
MGINVGDIIIDRGHFRGWRECGSASRGIGETWRHLHL